MLLELNIKNFALIENLSINFDNGLNILSGETGAGKSILIDAINYVLGAKFSKDLIRTGEQKTFVEAIFSIENDRTIKILNEYEIETEDLVIISRETFQNGKSIAKVNGKSLLLSHLKGITETLIDIHGQHENQNLLDTTKHIEYLDDFGGNELNEYMNKFFDYYEKLKQINHKIHNLQDKTKDKDKTVDIIMYQIEEIENAKLIPNEDEKLQEKYFLMSNSEKISEALNECYSILYEGNENNNSVSDSLSFIIKSLRGVEKNAKEISDTAQGIEDIYYNLEQYINNIRNIKENIYFDENELETINQRIYTINDLKKKYGVTINDILKYKEKIQIDYEEILNSTVIIDNLNKEYEDNKKVLLGISKEIHNIRCEAAQKLECGVMNELKDIGMEKSIFKINVNYCDVFYENGCDKVLFMISTNPGEPLKPLEKIASGGELSRIMLALKSVFVDKDKIATVIFDEIDTGISGRIAQRVAEKMYLISKKHQVFCITHLPQIACLSDTHYLVNKKIIKNKTYTMIEKLNEKEKEEEIARMIGGSLVTNLTLENSRELIKIANFKKNDVCSKIK